MPPQIQHKRGTSSDIASVNPILLDGEIVFETDTKKFKFGDGSTSWNNLPYAVLPNSGVSISGINIISGSGNFNTLTVSSVPVSVSGHSHTSSNITNFNTAVSGLVSGIYQPLLTNPVTGVGTSGYLTRWNGPNSVTSGIIFDNGTNVGIGINSPSEKLDIGGNTRVSGVLSIYDSSQSTFKTITASSNNLTFGASHGIFEYSIGLRGSRGSACGMESNATNGYLALAAGGSEKVRIATDGKVGIGTTTPSGQLHVVGTGIISSNLSIGSSATPRTVYISGAIPTQGELLRLQNGTSTNNSYLDIGVGTAGNYDDHVIFYRGTGTGSNTRIFGIDNSNRLLGFVNWAMLGNTDIASYNNANAYIKLQNTSTNNLQISAVNGILFQSQSSTRMTMDSAGNLGIGTSTPSGQLHVIGTGIVSSRLGVGTTSPQYALDVVGSGNFLNGLAISGVPIGEIIDDEVAGLLVAGSGITLNYNDSANTLTVDTNVTTSLIAGTGISLVYNSTTDELSINTNLTSSNISNFNSSVSELLPVTSILAGNNVSVATSGTAYIISSSGAGGGSSIKLGTIMALS